MLELLTLVIFVWLLVKAVGLVFRLTWGVAKAIAGILIGIASLLFMCLVFVGGIALILPITLIAVVLVILKICT